MQQIQKGFTLWKKKGVRFLTIPSFDRAGGVLCTFSTRIGGVSPSPFDTLNFSRSRESNQENFLENMRRYGEAAGFNSRDAVLDNYEHGVRLYRSHREDAGCGIWRDMVSQPCDGLYTDETGLPLISLHADCVPLFFYDPKRRAVAVCHAGWRGVTNHIIQNTMEALTGIGCKPGDMLAAVGPCISVRNFEVGEEVRDIFVREFGEDTVQTRDGRLYADLNTACVKDLLSCGLNPENVTVAGLCTYADPYLFFSHRRDKGQTGAMAAAILLKDE